MITQISIPTKIVKHVGDVLEKAGFVVGSSGGGTVEFERSGETTESEQKELIGKMTDSLASVFEFDIYDENEGCDEE